MKVTSGKKLPASQKVIQQPVQGKGLTSTTPVGFGYVKIFHQQGVKQSTNFQSGDVNYAVELYAKDEPKEIQRAIERAEQIVEDALGDKLPQMTGVLQGLAKLNGK